MYVCKYTYICTYMYICIHIYICMFVCLLAVRSTRGSSESLRSHLGHPIPPMQVSTDRRHTHADDRLLVSSSSSAWVCLLSVLTYMGGIGCPRCDCRDGLAGAPCTANCNQTHFWCSLYTFLMQAAAGKLECYSALKDLAVWGECSRADIYIYLFLFVFTLILLHMKWHIFAYVPTPDSSSDHVYIQT